MILAAAMVALSALSCTPKNNPEDPDNGNGNGNVTPGPASEITSNNAAPAGFVDDGPTDWDE